MSFDHCAFQVSNMSEAIEFYTSKLGFKLIIRAINEEEKEEYAFIEYENARLELIQDLTSVFERPEIKKPYCPHFCIEIDNMERMMKSLRMNNVNIIRGPLEIKEEETWVYFADQDNNVLEYIQWYKKK